MKALALPRNTTHQAEGPIHGEIARWLNRASGIVILLFVLVHVVAQAVLHVPALEGVRSASPWLPAAQNQPWIHALLYFSIAFHTLHGLRLILEDLGMRVDYRRALIAIVTISCAFGVRELARYAGI
jgi:succinate dehydrogenase/fumarate reductase cytochrome b subunit